VTVTLEMCVSSCQMSVIVTCI